jgi:hypothetical protein
VFSIRGEVSGGRCAGNERCEVRNTRKGETQSVGNGG